MEEKADGLFPGAQLFQQFVFFQNKFQLLFPAFPAFIILNAQEMCQIYDIFSSFFEKRRKTGTFS